MTITILGSASGRPVPHRNASGLMFEFEGRAALFDAGDGIARQIVGTGMELESIHSVWISHTHADHVSGLFMFLQHLHLAGRQNTLNIYLPEGVMPGFSRILPYFQIFTEKWRFKIDFKSMPGQTTIPLDGLRVTPILNSHLMENAPYAREHGIGTDAYSFRIDQSQGGSVLYTADVDNLHHLETWSDHISLLIAEMTHIPVEASLDFARVHGIPKVVFTHIPPEHDHARLSPAGSSASVEFVFAEDGNRYEIG